MSFVPDPDEWEDEDPPVPPWLTVDITEAEIVATLYDVNGEPLLELYDRDTVEFGFQPTVTPDVDNE